MQLIILVISFVIYFFCNEKKSNIQCLNMENIYIGEFSATVDWERGLCFIYLLLFLQSFSVAGTRTLSQLKIFIHLYIDILLAAVYIIKYRISCSYT